MQHALNIPTYNMLKKQSLTNILNSFWDSICKLRLIQTNNIYPKTKLTWNKNKIENLDKKIKINFNYFLVEPNSLILAC